MIGFGSRIITEMAVDSATIRYPPQSEIRPRDSYLSIYHHISVHQHVVEKA